MFDKNSANHGFITLLLSWEWCIDWASFSNLFFRISPWCGHTARPSDVMQMLPWPWPPAHTMPGPKWHRCRATFSLGQPGAALCRMWTVPTLLLCSLFSLSRSSLMGLNETLLQSRITVDFDDAKLVCFSFFYPPSPHDFSAIRTLLILCHSGVFSSAISWPGACALLSLGWVCLVDCSTGTDWHSSWGLQGLHTQSTKHVSVWGAALLPIYEVGVLIYHILSLFNNLWLELSMCTILSYY